MARKGRPSSCNTYGIMCGEPTIIIDNNLVFTLKTFDAILHIDKKNQNLLGFEPLTTEIRAGKFKKPKNSGDLTYSYNIRAFRKWFENEQN